MSVRIKEDILKGGNSLYYPQQKDEDSSHWQDIFDEPFLEMKEAQYWANEYISKIVIDTKYHGVNYESRNES